MIQPAPTHRYEPIAVSAESTVVAEFVPDDAGATAYQSEADLERELVRLLQGQAYEYLPVTTEAQLIANLRTQLEALERDHVLRCRVGAVLPRQDRRGQ